MTIRRDRTSMSPEHIRIAELAKEDRERKFSSIAHFLTVEALQEAFESLRKDASAGVDRVTYAETADTAKGIPKDRPWLPLLGNGGWVVSSVTLQVLCKPQCGTGRRAASLVLSQ